MDLIFETNDGNSFTIEATYFDSVLQIKDKIEKKVGYPASGQTLVFKGNIFPDYLKVHSFGFVYQSPITLLFSKIRLLLSLSSGRIVPLPIDLTDTILLLKHKIAQSIIEGGIPADRLQLYANGIELLDQRTIQDCGLLHDSEVELHVRPLKVTVVFRGQKILMEVNPSDMVGELKNKLADANLELPPEGCFFIHNHQGMKDNRSFAWHDVAEGDTIHMFAGWISGGS